MSASPRFTRASLIGTSARSVPLAGPFAEVSDLAFYRARRDEMRKAAAETMLANVRERCERAAEAFAELAARAERAELTREKERQRRAETLASAEVLQVALPHAQ